MDSFSAFAFAWILHKAQIPKDVHHPGNPAEQLEEAQGHKLHPILQRHHAAWRKEEPSNLQQGPNLASSQCRGPCSASPLSLTTMASREQPFSNTTLMTFPLCLATMAGQEGLESLHRPDANKYNFIWGGGGSPHHPKLQP
jgi:hypothetical protein